MGFTNIDTLVGIDIIIDYMFIAPYGGNEKEQKKSRKLSRLPTLLLCT